MKRTAPKTKKESVMGSSSDLKELLRERVAAKYTIDDLKETGKKIRETAPIESLAAVSKIDRDPVQFINRGSIC